MPYKPRLLTAGLLLSLNAFAAQAASLSVNGFTTGLVYDSASNITWTADANLLASLESADSGLPAAIINDIGSITDSLGVHTLTTNDFSGGGAVTWWGAEAYVAYLNFVGYKGQTDWFLPSIAELTTLFSTNLGELNGTSISGQHNSDYSLFSNVQSWAYWSGNEYGPNPYYAVLWNSLYSGANGLVKDTHLYAWAALPGEVAAVVPEPGVLWLLAGGLLVCRSLRRSI